MKLTRNELLYGTNTKTKMDGKKLDSDSGPLNLRAPYELPSAIDRLAWYKTRMEKLEGQKETKQVKVSKALCLDRIRRIARQLEEVKPEENQ